MSETEGCPVLERPPGRSAWIIIGGIFAGIAASAGDAPPADDWPRYGHDAALTGRTALRGDIESPRTAWSISLAGEEFSVEIRPGAGDHSLELPAAIQDTPAVPIPAVPLRDPDGSGRLRPLTESYHERWADVLPAVAGLERVAWDQTWTTAPICRLELFAHDEGFEKPRRVWQSEPEGDVFMPLCVVHDIDRDGTQEVLVALHYRVLIYEGTTGRKETELRFHSSRSYGWFGLAEIDGDPSPELVVLSDFQSHFDVLDLDASKPEAERLSVRWRRDIEQAIEERTKWPQVGPRPLVDLTGDGRPEIALNFFNDTGDEEWHAVVIDASSGKTLADLPRRYVHGSADLDGGGRSELLCGATAGVLVPELGRIEVVALGESGPSVVWSLEDAGFESADLPGPGDTWSTGATLGFRHALLTGEAVRPAFLVRRLEAASPGSVSAGALSMAAIRHDGKGSFRILWEARGLPDGTRAAALATSGESAAAVLRVPLGARARARIAASRARAVAVGRSSPAMGPFAPIAARPAPGEPLLVFAEGAGETVFAVRPPRRGGSPEIARELPGRGLGDGSLGPVAADLDGDGRTEILTAGRTRAGAALLSATRADGAVLWRRVFDRVPGARPVHNLAALTFYWPGRFRAPGALDVVVNTRRGLMHSDAGHLIDGRTGDLVWTRERAIVPGEFRWGFMGAPVAAADLVGRDGLDEIVNLYPVCYWAASGATGEIIRARELASRKALPAWAAYGEPMVSDFMRDGTLQVLLDSPYLLALLDADGKPLWHGKARRDYPSGKEDDNMGETTPTRHALADLDGDGRFEIASAGYRDGARAIDPRDGRILWSLDAPKPTGARCAAADIDGRKGDELIYPAGNELIAVTGGRESGRILWRWKGPAALSLPVIADLDGDGLAEIAVQSADGSVHAIDGPEM